MNQVTEKKQRKPMSQKLFERSTKLMKLQTDQQKREKTKIYKMRSEKWDITTNFTEIKRIIKEYCEKLNANKLDNLDKMDKLQEIPKLHKPPQKAIENINTPIRSAKIESVITNFSTKKNQGRPW